MSFSFSSLVADALTVSSGVKFVVGALAHKIASFVYAKFKVVESDVKAKVQAVEAVVEASKKPSA